MTLTSTHSARLTLTPTDRPLVTLTASNRIRTEVR